MQLKIRQTIAESIQVKQLILEDEVILDNIEKVVDVCTIAFKADKKVLFCGNGGSAADAQHLAAEFSGRFYTDREPLFAEALHVNSSYMTAVANDYSFDEVYERMIKAKGRQGDVLFGISTSGNSANVIRAVQKARQKQMVTVALTGQSGGKLAHLVDFAFKVPSTDTPRIQEAHILIGHIICEIVESKLFA